MLTFSVGADPEHPFIKPQPLTMADLSAQQSDPVTITEVSDYVFGGYTGALPSPPHADQNPKRAFIITWKDFPFRFVFAHEGSYCPWIEFPSGTGVCFQFFEGNDGWAELFNDYGRKEENSFVEVLEHGPKRVWVRWIYFGVNQHTGQRAYRATEDFWAYPNGHILRRQTFDTLMPGDHRGYAREPIELIGMCPKGKLWYDVLQNGSTAEERHALAVLDAFSTNRYDLFWQRKPGTLWDSIPRRVGDWKQMDDAAGAALVIPFKEGAAFCVLGDAGGYDSKFTRLKEHSGPENGGQDWRGHSWDHWPIGWLNSQANDVTAESLQKYPNHFSPAGMDLWALRNEEVERRVFYSLIGVGKDLELVRRASRQWLQAGEERIASERTISRLPKTYR